jgi:hypothetical protein
MAHMHTCPNCGERWECGEANYQDECPYPTRVLCLKCWARSAPAPREACEIATAEAKANCPVSRVLNAKITMTAALEG